MMKFIKTLASAIVIVIAFCCISSTRTLAQTTNSATTSQDDHEQTLKQLLNEVHALRMALQRATISNTRFQMLIERFRAEQTHIDSLRRDLEGLRSQLSELEAMKPRMEEQIKDAEDGLDRITDPNAHADVESRIKTMKGNLARVAPEETRLREREAALENELQSSQAKLDELNRLLDALMNDMKAP